MPVSVVFDAWAVDFKNPWLFTLRQDGDNHTAFAEHMSGSIRIVTPAHSHVNQANAILATLLSIVAFETKKKNASDQRGLVDHVEEVKSP